MGLSMAPDGVCLCAKVLISLLSQFSFVLDKMAHRTMGQWQRLRTQVNRSQEASHEGRRGGVPAGGRSSRYRPRPLPWSMQTALASVAVFQGRGS